MEENWNSLIDFRYIKDGIISGKSASEIEKIAIVTTGAENYDEEFPDLEEDIIRTLNETEKMLENKNTSQQTNYYTKMFNDFLTKNNLSTDFKKIPTNILDNYLRFFYASARSKNNSLYSPATLLCIRSSLNRFFNSAELNMKLNIVNAQQFPQSNRMLRAMVGKFLKEGGEVKNHTPMEKEDLRKLSEYFTRTNPTVLQDEVIYNTIYYFGQRGREHIRLLKKEDFIFINEDGKTCVKINKLPTKNVRGSCNSNDTYDIKQAVMSEIEDFSRCPVACLKLYLEKLPPESDCLFPKPLNNYTRDNWYSPKAVRGKDYLGNLMKTLSGKLHLSKTFTNHCIRSTVVTNLIDDGYDTSYISAVTGHKSAEALKKYATNKRIDEMAKCSKSLSSYMINESSGSSSSSASISAPPEKKIRCNEGIDNSVEKIFSFQDNSTFKSLFGSNNNITIHNINIYQK